MTDAAVPASLTAAAHKDLESQKFLTADATLAVLPTDSESSNFMIQDEKTGEEKPAVVLTTVEFVLVFVGLAFSVFLASLDQTIVAVALQAVASEFNSLDKINWIGTAFFLTATSFIPMYGQLADVFGRKPTFLLAIGIFQIGSLMCGAANSMNLLIAARAIQGVGGSGIFSISMIIIAD
ncbi:hypothetical protein HDU77_001392, partial [Chytriomyces hyalinus]